MELELELVVGGTIPTITSNFDALKQAIQARLEQYRIHVTEDNLAQAKKDATELGKAAVQLNKIKGEKAKEFSAPIDVFKAQVMELVGMIQEGQEFIRRQVEVFEEKTRARCLEMMQAAVKMAWDGLGVRDEFRVSGQAVHALVGISKITPAGNLTKAANESVCTLAASDRAIQDRVDGRLAKLEAECLKAGLKTPLEKAHVERWLSESDQCYADNLTKLIALEVERQEKTLRKAEEERLRAEEQRQAEERKAEEAKRKAEERQSEERRAKEAREAEQARKSTETPPPAPQAPAPIQTHQPPQQVPNMAHPIAPPPAGKTRFLVVVKFQIEMESPTQEKIDKTMEYFCQQFKAPGFPPHKITIEQGE